MAGLGWLGWFARGVPSSRKATYMYYLVYIDRWMDGFSWLHLALRIISHYGHPFRHDSSIDNAESSGGSISTLM